MQAGERLTLVPGVRVDYYSEIAEGSVNPRLTARFKLAPETTLKGGVGLFSQPPQYGEALAGIGNPALGLSWAQHYGLGVEQLLRPARQPQRRRLLQASLRPAGQRRQPDGRPAAGQRRQGAHLRPRGDGEAQPDGTRLRLRLVHAVAQRAERSRRRLAPVRLRPDAHPDRRGRLPPRARLGLRQHLPPGERQPAHPRHGQHLRRQQRLLHPGLRPGEQRAGSAVPPARRPDREGLEVPGLAARHLPRCPERLQPPQPGRAAVQLRLQCTAQPVAGLPILPSLGVRGEF